ncbi:MAG: Rpp14/Pop5 family protein [Candidatus Lokiarchaeota archaeon]
MFKIIKAENELFDERDFIRSLWKSIWRYFGMKLANKAGIWLIKLDLNSKYGILRCSHKAKEQIITSLAMIKKIQNFQVIISPVKCSGVLNKIEKLKEEFKN